MRSEKLEVFLFFVFILFLFLYILFTGDQEISAAGMFGFGALRAKLKDAKEAISAVKGEVRRLRKNEEVVLWHITPNPQAMQSILEGGFAEPRHEATLTEEAPWMPKWALGQQGEDRVSCGLPGLWMLPWMVMKEMLGEGGPILEIRIPREELMEKGTVMRTANAALPILTAPEINVPRDVMNRLLEEGRVRHRDDIPQMEFKEWLRLTLNGEQGLVPHAERELRKMRKRAKPYLRLIKLGAFAVGMKGSMEKLEPEGAGLAFIKNILRGVELVARRGWGPLSPEPELDAHLESFLQGIYDWEPSELPIPDFDFKIEVPKFEFPEIPSIDRMLEEAWAVAEEAKETAKA